MPSQPTPLDCAREDTLALRLAVDALERGACPDRILPLAVETAERLGRTLGSIVSMGREFGSVLHEGHHVVNADNGEDSVDDALPNRIEKYPRGQTTNNPNGSSLKTDEGHDRDLLP